MGYINPLLDLPASQKLLALPRSHRRVIAELLQELRAQANVNAETSWRRRKAPLATYWRAASTYARHVAHAFSRPAASQIDYTLVLEAGECLRIIVPSGARFIAVAKSGEVIASTGDLENRSARKAPSAAPEGPTFGRGALSAIMVPRDQHPYDEQQATQDGMHEHPQRGS